MSVILPADHHATFTGWTADKRQIEEKQKFWSSRKRIAFLVLTALASWMLILAPYFLLR